MSGNSIFINYYCISLFFFLLLLAGEITALEIFFGQFNSLTFVAKIPPYELLL
jgi:hypothetical protein